MRPPWPGSWWPMSRPFAPTLDRLLVRTIKGASPGLNPLGNPLPPTASTEVTVWTRRMDFRAKDQLNIGDGAFFALSDTRFVVRAEGLAWNVGDVFTIEGDDFTVRGVSQMDRGRFLELLARSAG